MKKSGFKAVVFALLIWLVSVPAQALEFRLGLLHGDADVFDFELGIFKLALEHADGDHELEIVPMSNTVQNRIFNELQQGKIDLFFSGYSAEREAQFLQVDFPLTRGLLGHRVFLIRNGGQGYFDTLNGIEDFQKHIAIGSGVGWPETKIFRDLGLKVIASTYQNLWGMLQRDRFQAFHRGIHEVQVELQQRRSQGIALEQKHLFLLKYDYFAYVRKNDIQRHRILSQGLARIVENGSFEEYFFSHPMVRDIQERVYPHKRQKIDIPNPEIADVLKRIPEHYWLDLTKEETDQEKTPPQERERVPS